MTIAIRGAQILPTRRDIRNAWRVIREASESGDVQAAAMLISLSGNSHAPMTPSEAVADIQVEMFERLDQANG
jgi:hypothetical protein